MSKKKLEEGWGFKPYGGFIRRVVKQAPGQEGTKPREDSEYIGDPFFEDRIELALQRVKESGLPIPPEKARLAILRYDTERRLIPPMPQAETLKAEFEKISFLAGELSKRLKKIRHPRLNRPIPLDPQKKRIAAIDSLTATLEEWAIACAKVDLSNAPKGGPQKNFALESFIREFRQLFIEATGETSVTKIFVETVATILSDLGAPAQSIEALAKQARAIKLQ